MEHGGSVIMNEIRGKSTRLIAGEKRGVAFCSTEGKDVIDVHWLLLSIEESRLLPLNHSFLLQTSEATRASWSMVMDEYGDHYKQDTSACELQQVLRSMASLPSAAAGDVDGDLDPQASIRRLLQDDPTLRIPSLLFGGTHIFIWNAASGRDGMPNGIPEHFEHYVDGSQLIGAKLIRHGAVLAMSIDDAELVVVPNSLVDCESAGLARRVAPKLIGGAPKRVAVSEEWVHASIQTGSLQRPQDFMLQ
jgi:hypothetical protein